MACCNKCTRSIFLVFLTGVCVYQVSWSLLEYYQYQTLVSIDMYMDSNPIAPATTICPNIPLLKWKDSENNASDIGLESKLKHFGSSQSWIRKFTDKIWFTKCKHNSNGKFDGKNSKACEASFRTIVGMEPQFYPCFTMNSVFKSRNQTLFDSPVGHIDAFAFVGSLINITDIPDKIELSVLVFVHDRMTVATREELNFMEQIPFSCNIYVSKTLVKRLQSPFKSNCTDYVKQYELSGQGDMTEQMCELKCIWRYSLDKFGCIFKHGLVFNEDIGHAQCRPEVFTKTDNYTEIINEITRKCDFECNPACEESFYKGDVSCLPVNLNKKNEILLKALGVLSGYTPMESVIFTTLPKQTPLELFGHICGFCGIWIGLSVPQVLNFATFLVKTLKGLKNE